MRDATVRFSLIWISEHSWRVIQKRNKTDPTAPVPSVIRSTGIFSFSLNPVRTFLRSARVRVPLISQYGMPWRFKRRPTIPRVLFQHENIMLRSSH